MQREGGVGGGSTASERAGVAASSLWLDAPSTLLANRNRLGNLVRSNVEVGTDGLAVDPGDDGNVHAVAVVHGLRAHGLLQRLSRDLSTHGSVAGVGETNLAPERHDKKVG